MSATLGPRRAEAAVAEDAAAGTRALYERHGERIFSFCFSRLRDVEDAQDATQTTFLYAMRSLDNGIEPRFELAWLLAIAHNVCRSARRSRNRRDARVSYADVTELEAAAESIGDETGEELAWIRDALERLPENQRRAILLREWQGLSYADIAAELHLSLAAVETLLFRARRALNRHVERAKRGLKALDLTSLGPSRPPTESPPAAGVSPPSPVQVVEDTIDGVTHPAPAVPVDPTGVVDAAPPLPQLGLPSP